MVCCPTTDKLGSEATVTDGSVRYRFLAVVGEGGFGRVYRARLEAGDDFSKDVAVKLLNAEAPPRSLLERFRDEARILGLIRDRAIVGVEPPIKIGDRWAVVMDFVDGCSCATVLGKAGPLPPGVAVEIVGEVARALHSAYHQQGPEGEPLQLLHRDIKPENIQVTPSGDVRVLDFGIAKANFAAREFKTRHAFGGTPGYIAPERLQRVEVAEGDVYSLGVVLHELVVGERPSFPPKVDNQTVDQFGEGVAPSHHEIHVDPEDLVMAPELRANPHVLEVLELAAWMRAYDVSQRPNARQVEEACREMRRKLPGVYFRDWAEQEVPHRVEMELEAPDPMVGRTLVARPGVGTDGGRETTATGGNLALGAMLGGGVVLALSGLAVLLLATSVGVVLWLQAQRGAVASPGAPDGVDAVGVVDAVDGGEAGGALSEVVATDEPGEATEPGELPDGTPHEIVEPPRPSVSPAPSEAQPRRLVLQVPAEAASAPEDYTPDLSPGQPTGTVVVRTTPSGASLWKGGDQLEPFQRGEYRLPKGSHRLVLISAAGEKHPLTLTVKPGERIPVCYDFDADRACGQ